MARRTLAVTVLSTLAVVVSCAPFGPISITVVASARAQALVLVPAPRGARPAISRAAGVQDAFAEFGSECPCATTGVLLVKLADRYDGRPAGQLVWEVHLTTTVPIPPASCGPNPFGRTKRRIRCPAGSKSAYGYIDARDGRFIAGGDGW